MNYQLVSWKEEHKVEEHTSIRDVAEAAGVSVSTVSNVLNRPHAVATRTREKVLGAIESLKFQRNEQAASLRLNRPSARTPKQGPRPEPAQVSPPQPYKTLLCPGCCMLTEPDEPGRQQIPLAEPDDPGWQQIPVAEPVEVVRLGNLVGSGLADGSMPDGSAIWVRFDDGRGRLLLAKVDGFIVTPTGADKPVRTSRELHPGDSYNHP